MDDVLLVKNKGYKWYKVGNVYSKGYAWYDGMQFINEKLAAFFEKIDQNDWESILDRLNGCFSFVINNDDFVYIISDVIRSIPMFYRTDSCIVSDDVLVLKEKADTTVDSLAVKESLKSSLYTCNDRTWFNEIKQNMAGEIVCIDKKTGEVRKKLYWQHVHKGTNSKTAFGEYYKEAEEVSFNVFRRLVDFLDGRFAIIPLSGGYDSRYIVAMLKRLGYEKVICYTYGKRNNNFEVTNSKNTADALGYKHYFVEYKDDILEKNIFGEIGDEYRRYATCGSNVTHVQEIAALIELKKKPDFPQDGVVIPGFCGDLFGGSYTFDINQSRDYNYNENLLVENIYNRFFQMHNCDNEVEVKNDIKHYINYTNRKIRNLEEFNSLSEQWFLSHKLAQFIINAVRPYEYMGYSWYLPLWDKELLKFWYSIPMEYKMIPSLYDKYLFECIFNPLEINFVKMDAQSKRTQIEIEERPSYRKWITGLFNYINLKFGLQLRFWTNDPDCFLKVNQMTFRRIKNKQYINMQKVSVNSLLLIMEMEAFIDGLRL